MPTPTNEGRRARSLRIVHIVAHVSPDGRYGGPLRVAADLASAQREQGHQVRMIATYEGYTFRPTSWAGTPLSAFPSRRIARRGYATLFSMRLLFLVGRTSRGADVTHVHLARDALTSPSAFLLALLRAPFVIQTHGMIEKKNSLPARLFDRLIIAPTVRRAAAVFTLTSSETRHLASLGASIDRLIEQPNGVRLDVVTAEERTQVLFLARLHPRKGAKMFAAASSELATTHPTVDFVIAGPDEGDLDAVETILDRAGRPTNVRVLGPVPADRVGAEMARSLLYVLPAQQEPFGLTILEALAQGTPVLVHSSAHLGAIIRQSGAGETFDGDARRLAQSIEVLLTDRARLASLADGARALALNFDHRTIATDITSHYPMRGASQ